MSVPVIAPRVLHDLRSGGAGGELIDVRTPVEFREVHAAGARNVPLDTLDPHALMKGRSPTETVYFVCRSGSRGRMACEAMAAAGYAGATNVEGGMQAWEQAGLPVIRGKKAISLERQVRIAAGSLVLVGVGLGLLHPAFLGLAAFVGAGLVFAGVTDTCGMGLLLARMPWNRVKECAR